MGYYLNILKPGQIYELDGIKLQFIEKIDKWYYFYICKLNELTFNYEPTKEKRFYKLKDLAYLKRVDNGKEGFNLRQIGKDKVFPRN